MALREESSEGLRDCTREGLGVVHAGGAVALRNQGEVVLAEEHAGVQPKTMRERLAQHRDNPVCAGCHSRIDPLGFALENYDALG